MNRVLFIVGALLVASCSPARLSFSDMTQYVKDERTGKCFITTRSTNDFVMEEVECSSEVLQHASTYMIGENND